MKQTGNDNVRVIADIRFRQESSPPQNIVGDESNQQRMLDIVIERVAVADAIDGKPGSRLDPFYRSRIR